MNCFDIKYFVLNGMVSIVAFLFFMKIEKKYSPNIKISDLLKPTFYLTVILSLLYLFFLYKNPISTPKDIGDIAERLTFGFDRFICMFDDISTIVAAACTLMALYSKYRQLKLEKN